MPGIPDAHYYLALIHEERGEFNGALEQYKKEVGLHPVAYLAHYNLAKLYLKIGKMKKVIKYCQK